MIKKIINKKLRRRDYKMRGINKDQCVSYIRENFNTLSQREMARRLDIGKTTVNSWSSEIGLKFKKHTVNENFFKDWSEEMAYILGLIFTDGNIAWDEEKSRRSLTITASEKDKENLERIRNLMNSTKPLLYSKKTKSYRLIVVNKKICLDLMNMGVIPRKSLTLEFPKIPKKVLRHFIRGAIDGDGTVYYLQRKRSPYFKISFCSGSEKFIKSLVNKIELSTGIKTNIRNREGKLFLTDYTCKRGIKLANWIYKDSNIHLERKHKHFQIALKNGGVPL
jgi:hypothetical protein